MSQSNRRDFFKKLLLGAAAIPLVRVSDAMAKACAAPKTDKVKKKLLDYKSKQATRLNFVANAADGKGHKKFKAGSDCGNCKFYKADKAEPTYGKCAMVANKYVPTCGWCKSWKVNKKKK